MRQPLPPTASSGALSRFRQSWTAACLFSLVLHGALFQLSHLGLSQQSVNLPVQAYLVVAEPRGDAPAAAIDAPIEAVEARSASSQKALPTPVERRTARLAAKVSVDDVSVLIAAPGELAPMPTDEAARASIPPSAAASTDRQVVLQASSSTSLLELNILEWLQRHRRYPRSALRSRLQGDVGVRFVIDRQGRLLSAEVVSSSGYKLLDQAALELLQRAQPYPLPPLDPGVDRLELSLPVAYRLAPGSS